MSVRLRSAVLLIAALSFVGSIACGQAVTLNYKMEKGEVYRYAETMVMNTTQEMMGQEMKVLNNLSGVVRVVVEGVKSGGGYSLLVSTDTMSIHVKNPRMDSTLVPTEMFGKRNRLHMASTGKILAREVVDSIKAGGLMRGAGALAQKELLTLPVLPEKSVTTGETWSNTREDTSDAMGGKSISVTTWNYTYDGMQNVGGRDLAKVSFTGKMSVTSKGSMMGAEVFTEGGGTMKGVFYFDQKKGCMVSSDLTMNTDLTAAVTGQQNMTIPISQSGSVKINLLAN